MPGFKDRVEGHDTTVYDGAEIFTESHRKQALEVLRTGSPNHDLNTELRRLAWQKPFPSHQASFFISEIVSRGLGLVPGFDELMAEAWRADGEGLPHLAQLALADSGINYDFYDDGR